MNKQEPINNQELKPINNLILFKKNNNNQYNFKTPSYNYNLTNKN